MSLEPRGPIGNRMSNGISQQDGVEEYEQRNMSSPYGLRKDDQDQEA